MTIAVTNEAEPIQLGMLLFIKSTYSLCWTSKGYYEVLLRNIDDSLSFYWLYKCGPNFMDAAVQSLHMMYLKMK